MINKNVEITVIRKSVFTVEAESQQQAEAVVLSGNCNWEVDRDSDGSDFYLVDEQEVSNE